ncbi:hypothetical protein CCYA_CCYA03G0945 [Cyanidiococcus yangmingshanensis]|nr:hypothetical protein CCYA_CCYA03G0945 [Cyanidiococcus yangmingshanensis]
MAKSPSLLPYALPSRARILLTGSTGCIGSHIAVELLTHTDCTLELLVRGGTLRFVAEADEALRNGVELGRVHVHDVDLAAGQGLENEQLRTIVGICDALILCAASWGGDTAHAVNVASVLATIRAVNKRRCRKIVYFSTASVIAPQGRLLIQEAIRWGTDYIRSKAIALVELVKAMSDISETPVSLTIVFPTLVLGRRSHIGKALDTDAAAKMNHSPLYRGAKYALRFMHMESAIRAHFIHAADCAQVVRRLLFCVVSASFKTLDKIDLTPPTLVPSVQQPSQTAYLVLGQQPPFSYDDVVRALCRLYGLRVPSRWLRIPADPLLWLMVHRLIPVDPWTRYCLRRRRELFVFPQAVRPEDFGGISVAPDLYTALEQSRTRFTAEQSTREISSAI